MALLSWRSPPRLGLYLVVPPDEAGIGHVPAKVVSAVSGLRAHAARVGPGGENGGGADCPPPGSSRRAGAGLLDQHCEIGLVLFELVFKGQDLFGQSAGFGAADVGADAFVSVPSTPFPMLVGL